MTFTFELLTLKLVRVIGRVCATFLPILVFLELFVLDILGQQLSEGPRDLSTLTFNLGGHGTYQ